MDQKLTRNWIIVLAVLAISVLLMYPPGQKLVLGPDLAGGTTLLYEVTIPEGADAQATLKEVIRVVSRRIDPNGVRNLTFQVEGSNRIQVLMPHPSPEVAQKRQAYQDQLKKVTESNVNSGRLLAALALEGDARKPALEALVQGVEARKPLFTTAEEMYDAVEAAKKARAEAKAAPGTDQDIELAGKVEQADFAFQQVLKQVEATNLDPIALGHLLELPTKNVKDETTGKEKPDSSPRAVALAGISAQQPSRKEQIAALVTAYDAYFSMKRPLDDPNDLIRLMRGQGVLEFRIGVDPQEAANLAELQQTLRDRGPRAVPADAPMRWYVVDNIESWVTDVADRQARNSTTPARKLIPMLREQLQKDPQGFLLQNYELIGGTDGKDYYVLCWNTREKSLTGRKEQAGWQLTKAGYDVDPNSGLPCVGFQMNELGGSYLGELTKNNIKRQMAIVLDGRVYSAPSINSQINHSGIITGKFSHEELNYLINTLSAGSLQASLSHDPIEVRTIQPSLGQENLQQGLKAGLYSIIAVGVFMIGYYYFGGLVANLALLANLVIVLGVMALTDATFTMAGIAGLILNIGMCVDANVLIFERIREELRRGADMMTALRVGHDRAFSAILDGNLTTLIVCVFLGWLGTADVRGFGITLGVGLVATLFTAVFMTQVIFKTWYGKFRHAKMGMLPLTFPAMEKALRPTVDWMSKRNVFYGVSIAACVVSLGLCFARGADFFDIEFRSGTEVSFDLKEGATMTQREVKDTLKGSVLEDAAVVVVGDTDKEFRASQFSVIASVSDSDAVSKAIRQALGDRLNIKPVLAFKGSDAKQAPEGVVVPVKDSDLGKVIGRDVRHDVSDYRGGAAVVLEGITPSTTLSDVNDRVKAMRLQPDYESLQFRPFEVVGVTPDPAKPDHFTAVAVVSRDPTVNYFDSADVWRQSMAESEWGLIQTAMTREQSLSKVSRISPTVARTLVNNAVVSLGLSMIAILAYIWVRFGSLRYGVTAVIAMAHDVVITLGFIAVSGLIYDAVGANFLLITPFKINMGMIAALLTIVGYSLNDTIVVFDRIRENRGKLATASAGVINDSINQTFSRTFLTGGGVLMSVLIIYFVAGEAIRGFALAMFVGIIAGTYSSIAIAAPLLIWGEKTAPAPENPEKTALSAAR